MKEIVSFDVNRVTDFQKKLRSDIWPLQLSPAFTFNTGCHFYAINVTFLDNTMSFYSTDEKCYGCELHAKRSFLFTSSNSFQSNNYQLTLNAKPHFTFVRRHWSRQFPRFPAMCQKKNPFIGSLSWRALGKLSGNTRLLSHVFYSGRVPTLIYCSDSKSDVHDRCLALQLMPHPNSS